MQFLAETSKITLCVDFYKVAEPERRS